MPRITDPRRVPVVEIDRHLPAVPAASLSAEALRRRFARPLDFEPPLPGDAVLFDRSRPLTPAAVLVPLVRRAEGLQVLLTERTAHLRDHAGQISFPGGRQEADEGPVACALRETEEECGVDRRHVEVLGRMPAYQTVTSYHVTPVVALLAPDFALTPDPFEVADVFEVPLAFLMDPAHHHRHRLSQEDGQTRHFLSMPWTPAAGGPAAQAPHERFIWGATAAMLRNFYHLLAGTQARA